MEEHDGAHEVTPWIPRCHNINMVQEEARLGPPENERDVPDDTVRSEDRSRNTYGTSLLESSC
ncbi:hypothetical protein C8T65DRAFT_637363 [Cerioporus squamosus]|nr:hypothetical protein C8T65DRAFT_637363 [Cerioporus squamosus]